MVRREYKSITQWHFEIIPSLTIMSCPQIEGVSSQLDSREGNRRNLPHVWPWHNQSIWKERPWGKNIYDPLGHGGILLRKWISKTLLEGTFPSWYILWSDYEKAKKFHTIWTFLANNFKWCFGASCISVMFQSVMKYLSSQNWMSKTKQEKAVSIKFWFAFSV